MEGGAEGRKVLMAALCIYNSITLLQLSLCGEGVRWELRRWGSEIVQGMHTWKKALVFSRWTHSAGTRDVMVFTSWSGV